MAVYPSLTHKKTSNASALANPLSVVCSKAIAGVLRILNKKEFVTPIKNNACARL